jgi:hypothetical protein
VQGGVTYTKERREATLGPLEFSIEDKETVRIPIRASIGAIVGGTALLLVRAKR